ncbi:hypothetical protein CD170_10840 [Staphylococcus aureus]|nr:hypothetical protein CD170_10840 [Staphylococcus aureus]
MCNRFIITFGYVAMLRILMLMVEILSFNGAIVIEKFYGNVVAFKIIYILSDVKKLFIHT